MSIPEFCYAGKKYVQSALIVIGIVCVTSCKDSDDPTPAVKTPVCKVILQTNNATGNESPTVTYAYISKFGYTYDDKDNQVGSSVNYNYTYSDGTKATYSSTTSNQFDDNGYVVRTVSQTNRTEKDNKSSFSKYNYDYAYENKRLIKWDVESSENNGAVTKYSLLYEYDAEGKLTKFTNGRDNAYIKIEYSGTSIQKVTKVDAGGNISSPFFEFNSKGWLTKAIETSGGYTEEYRYEYTSDGAESRQERYINGKPSSASTLEYDTKENPYDQQYGLQKGQPWIPGIYNQSTNKHNVTKSVYYTTNAADEWVVGSTTNYVYDYNANGFPTTVNSKSFDAKGTQVSTYNNSYDYQDCQ